MSNKVLCTSCNEEFACGEEQRIHYKTERHMYNVKRRLENLAPIPQDVWERKLKRFAEIRDETSKKQDHVKESKKEKNKKKLESKLAKGNNGPVPEVQPITKKMESDLNIIPEDEEAVIEALPELKSLFDSEIFETMDENLNYMMRHYCFNIPEKAYCINISGLLDYLHKKIKLGHQCLYCDKGFKSEQDCRRHMLDMKHSRIGMEGYSRTGKYSQEKTDELLYQLEEFYDFRTSYKEITAATGFQESGDKFAQLMIQNEDDREALKKERETPEGMLKHIFKAFDEDGDDNLSFEEAKEFYLFYTNEEEELSLQEYEAFTKEFGCKFTLEALKNFFEMTDLNIVEEYKRFINDGWHQVIVECEDEEDYDKVIQAYGLRKARIDEFGNLALPNGKVATHRNVQYVYKQKGMRWDATKVQEMKEKKALENGAGKRGVLMLGNGGNGDSIALSNRECRRQGKQIIAILKYAQKIRMRLGCKQNIIQKKDPKKIATIRGDMSGGR